MGESDFVSPLMRNEFDEKYIYLSDQLKLLAQINQAICSSLRQKFSFHFMKSETNSDSGAYPQFKVSGEESNPRNKSLFYGAKGVGFLLSHFPSLKLARSGEK